MKIVYSAFAIALLAFSLYAQTRKSIVVTVVKANLRGTASTSGPVISEVFRGQTFTVVSRHGRWVLVQTPEYVGWLHQTVVARYTSDSTRDLKYIARPKLEPVEPLNPNRLSNGASPLGNGYRSGRSTLFVENGTDNDALVRVIRFVGDEQLIRNFYVSANETFTAEELPAGTYVLRVAFGSDWNDAERKFNFRRSFSQTETFEVTEKEFTEPVYGGVRKTTRFSRLSITLHKIRDGNFSSKTISEDDFWRLNN